MLAIVSDLHLTDGTTSNWAGDADLFNVKPGAFRLLYAKIADAISRRTVTPRKVTLVFNGDIFDLLRTAEWFGVNEADRPWSVPLLKENVRRHCRTILKRTIQHNSESLSWLNGSHPDFPAVWGGNPEVERVYIPGNHDRIINLDRQCRELVHEHLLGRPGNGRFRNFYADRDHQALAEQDHQTLVMHGHEGDPFNCEFDTSGNPRREEIPIGDPMTTMLFARLGHEASKLDIPDAAKARFRDIDNVRPALSGVRYVQDIIRDFRVGDQVRDMIRMVVSDFEALDFVQRWQDRHDRLSIGYDEADKLQAALRAIKLLGTSVPAGLLERLAGFLSDDSYGKLARKHLESDLGREAFRYCVFGHTHESHHAPVSFDRHLGMEKHYLNSGTFRTTFVRTLEGHDFLRYQQMSFVLIYGPDEFDPGGAVPVYEMWSGLRMRH